jgi:hypothetical protein
MVSPFDTCFEAWKSANPFCWAHATLGQSAMASKSRILCVEAWHFDDISRKRWHAKSRRKNEFLEKHITIIFVEENQGGTASLHPSLLPIRERYGTNRYCTFGEKEKSSFPSFIFIFFSQSHRPHAAGLGLYSATSPYLPPPPPWVPQGTPLSPHRGDYPLTFGGARAGKCTVDPSLDR